MVQNKKRQRKRYIDPITKQHGKQITFVDLLNEVNDILDIITNNFQFSPNSRTTLLKICHDMDQALDDLCFAYNFQKFPVKQPADYNRHNKEEWIVGFTKTTFDIHTGGIVIDFSYKK